MRQRYRDALAVTERAEQVFTVVPSTRDVQSRPQGLCAEGAFRVHPQASW